MILPLLALTALSGAEPPPNLVLVTIDTLRADRVGAYGRRPSPTPAIDALASEGLVFEDVTAPQPLTLPSHATILTGLSPEGHGARSNAGSVPEGVPAVAERLRERGYATAAFVSGAPVARGTGLERGFDRWDDERPDDPDGGRSPRERRAAKTAAAAGEWLSSAPEPFFVWIHFYDPHHPYGKESSVPRAEAYEREVQAADAGVGMVVRSLRRRGVSDRTAILATSDHGEALGEHGESTHGVFLYQETVRVPLVLLAPGVPPGRRPEPAGLVDVAPTLLGLAGLDGEGLPGVDLRSRGAAGGRTRSFLLETTHPRDRYGWSALRGVRRGNLKLIEAPASELYALDADPREARNRLGERPDDAADLKREIAALAGGAPPGRPGAAAVSGGEPPPERAEALRSLGYAWSAPLADDPGRNRPDPKDRAHLLPRLERASDDLFAGRYREAVDALALVLQEDPGNFAAWNDRGMAERGAGRPHAAVRSFRRALEGSPRDPVLWNNLGSAQAASGHPEGARSAFGEASRLAPQFAAPVANRAALEFREGNLTEARTLAEHALRLDPGLTQTRELLDRLRSEDPPRTARPAKGGHP